MVHSLPPADAATFTETVSQIIPHVQFKEKQRAGRNGFTEALGLPIHRAISRIGRAEAETEDEDVRFILGRIAFNAAYTREDLTESAAEWKDFRAFLARLVALDRGERIYQILWSRYSQEIRVLFDNRYVFSPFWLHQNGVTGYENREERFATACRYYGTSSYMAGRHGTVPSTGSKSETEPIFSQRFCLSSSIS